MSRSARKPRPDHPCINPCPYPGFVNTPINTEWKFKANHLPLVLVEPRCASLSEGPLHDLGQRGSVLLEAVVSPFLSYDANPSVPVHTACDHSDYCEDLCPTAVIGIMVTVTITHFFKKQTIIHIVTATLTPLFKPLLQY